MDNFWQNYGAATGQGPYGFLQGDGGSSLPGRDPPNREAGIVVISVLGILLLLVIFRRIYLKLRGEYDQQSK